MAWFEILTMSNTYVNLDGADRSWFEKLDEDFICRNKWASIICNKVLYGNGVKLKGPSLGDDAV